MVIQPLKNTQPQLAKYLAMACWTWQAEQQCLYITLQSRQIQKQLKNNNSLLLRYLQKILGPTEISPLAKLSFLNQYDNPPEGFSSTEETEAQAPFISEEVSTSPTGSADSDSAPEDSGKSSCPNQLDSPERSPDFQTEPTAEPQAQISTAQSEVPPESNSQTAEELTDSVPIVSSGQIAQPELSSASEDQAAQAGIVDEQTISDYSQLPQEVQILQKIFLAQVKKVQRNPSPPG